MRPGAPVGPTTYKIDIIPEYWVSTTRVDSEGNEDPFENDEAFSMLNVESRIRYGYSRSLEFLGGLNFRGNTATFANGNNNVETQASGLESFFGRVNYFFSSSKSHYYLFFRAKGTTYENTNFGVNDIVPNEIDLGDGGNEYGFGGGFGTSFSKWHHLNGEIEYRVPGNELSTEVPYLLDSAWAFQSFGLGLTLDGVFSLGNSPFTSEADRQIQTHGPTLMFNSVNRSFLRLGGRIFFALTDSWQASIFAKSIVSGTSTDYGFSIGGMLSIVSFGKSEGQFKVESFKEYSLEGSVIKVSPRGRFVQIDRGFSSDVEKGQRFDLYRTDFVGGNTLVALGVVYEVTSDKAILKILKRYRSEKIVKGLTARSR